MGNHTPPKAPITPVLGASGCLGHVRPTAKGFVAYDVNDKPIGLFGDSAAAVLAILQST